MAADKAARTDWGDGGWGGLAAGSIMSNTIRSIADCGSLERLWVL